MNKQNISAKCNFVFALFIHPSIYTDGLYYCVSRCEAGFSVRNCVVFLAGTVRHACIGFPCGGRVKRATTPDAQPRCSTWQQHVDSLHTSPHFSPFLSHCFLIQPKDKEKQHQSSIRCKNIIPTPSWMMPSPPKQWNTWWVYDILVYRKPSWTFVPFDMAAVLWRVAIWSQWAENTDGNFSIQTMSGGWFSPRAPAESRGEITGTKMSLDCEVLLIREGEWQDLNAGNICEERFH